MHGLQALYKLTTKDINTALLQTLFINTSGSSAAVSVSNLYRVPMENIAHISNIRIIATGGGGQTVTSMSIQIIDPGGTVIVCVLISKLSTVVQDFLNIVPYSLIVPSGYYIAAIAAFSAGVATNTVGLSIAGMLSPRGNVT